ncbi:EexN family lipoprotein [Stenotrophomonas maltophilia]|uniref:Entry exclusion lipoprotein TrbK n=1 Tax=Stenotrophomonas maltophilia (strain K279a) TaxID=522373 RepID=B2FTF3_STRMK|nr:EexN family lipoprotein [Stenotrophomonas maltophilia]EKU9962303.1 EexN family lipoprotein [Stenotrophomonas maltophilia]MBA0337447.1 entry exclusion lipoprotein TrbK [Stenotrophomonas maltophilia]MBA0540858.1 entry exclusion lipoprotein TrbK [Stenotrophomonas maltophilia]MBH1741142.1 EexN family lipoprotein [Stenotrophomonas maltophilia]MBY8924923.1 EexN family lipoprotein [Stenotrophomonas maltophilia]
MTLLKVFTSLLLSALLAACGQSSNSTDTVESLAANPERLKDLRQQCKLDRVKLGDALCNRVAEATRRRFMGDGKVPYTPPKESPKF